MRVSSITPSSLPPTSVNPQAGSTVAQGGWFQTVTPEYGDDQKQTRWGTAINAFDVYQHALEVSRTRTEAGHGVHTSVDTYPEFIAATVRNGGTVVYDRHYDDGRPDTQLKLGKGDRIVQSDRSDNASLIVERSNGTSEELKGVYIPVGTRVVTVN